MKRFCYAIMLISIFSYLCLFSSCSSTARNTEEKCNNNYDIIKHTTLSNVYSSAEAVLNNKYDNLIMPENICFKTPEKLYNFSIMQTEENIDKNSDENKIIENKFIKLITDYSGETPKNNDIIFNVYDYESVVFTEYTYTDDNNFLYSYNSNGSFSINDNNFDEGKAQMERCLSFGFTDSFNNIDEINGFTVSEALDICQKKVINKITDSINEDKLEPYSISKFKNSDGTHSYYIVYSKEYLGLNLSESGEYIFADSGFMKPSYLCIKIHDDKKIYSIINMYSNVYDKSTIKEIKEDSYISLETACSLLSDYLAKYNVYNIEKIDITYCMPTRFEANTSNLVYKKYLPCYEITLQSKLQTNGGANLTPRKTAYIDMVTGDIFLSDSIDMQQYFILN